jgi:hypothetical protein
MRGKKVPPNNIVEIGDQFYIHAQSSLPERTLVLLHGELNVVCETDGVGPQLTGYDKALLRITNERNLSSLADLDIYTSNEQFNAWVDRSQADLDMMIASTVFGPYPYAGPMVQHRVRPRWHHYSIRIALACPFSRQGVLSLARSSMRSEREKWLSSGKCLSAIPALIWPLSGMPTPSDSTFCAAPVTSKSQLCDEVAGIHRGCSWRIIKYSAMFPLIFKNDVS